MKARLALLGALILGLMPLAVSADQVWDEPLRLYGAQNSTFNGTGCPTGYGGYVLFWLEADQTGQLKLLFQRYSAEDDPQLPAPAILSDARLWDKPVQSLPSSDGNYFLGVTLSNYTKLLKVSPQGEVLWSVNTVSSFSSDTVWGIAADNQGGIYFWLQTQPTANLKLFHLNANGANYLAGGANLCTNNSYRCQVNLLVQPDDSVCCAVKWNYTLRFLKISPELQILNDVSDYLDDEYIYTARLARDNSGNLYLLYVLYDMLGNDILKISCHVLRVDAAGNSVWPAALEVLTSIGPDWVNNMDNVMQDCAMAPLSDGRMLFAFCRGNTMQLQKFDAAGATFFNNQSCPVELINPIGQLVRFSLFPLSAGRAFIHLHKRSSNDMQVASSAFCIGPEGFAPAQETLIASITVPAWVTQGYWYPGGFFCFPTDGELNIVYQQTASAVANLLHVRMGTDAALEDPVTLRTTTFGSARNPVQTPLHSNVLAAWIENVALEQYMQPRERIRYQIIDREGNTQLTDPGILPSDGSLGRYNYLQARTLANGVTLLAWAVTSSPRGIRAQLLGSNGLPLWEPAGRVIVSGDQYISTERPFLLSEHDGSYYFVWQGSAEEIRGQRLESGNVQWGSAGRALLTEADLPYPNTWGFWPEALEGNALAYSVRVDADFSSYAGFVGLLCFDAEGAPLPGFAPGGINACPYNHNYFGLRFQKLLSTPAGLIVSAVLIYHYYNPYDASHYYSDDGTYVNMYAGDGTPVWTSSQPDVSDPVLLCADESGYYQATYSALRKYNLQHQLLWSAPVERPPRAVVAVDSGSFIGVYDISYFCFTDSGSYYQPHDYILSDVNVIPPTISAWSEGALITWINSTGLYNYPYSDTGIQLFAQRVNMSPSDVEEPPLPPVQPVVLGNHGPNPFSGEYAFDLNCVKSLPTEVRIFNLRGQIVRGLFSGLLPEGGSHFVWDGRDARGAEVSSGIYLCQIRVKGFKPVNLKLLKY